MGVLGWNCLCHFPDGSVGVYRLADERLLIGSRTTIIGLEGLWIVTEMNPPDEAEVVDAELWLRPATDEELVSKSGFSPETTTEQTRARGS